MTKLKELCDCGQPAATHDRSGNPLCKDCMRFDMMARLRQGKAVTISGPGTRGVKLVPHLGAGYIEIKDERGIA